KKKHLFLKAKGLGYAMNTVEELKFFKDITKTTGVILDLHRTRVRTKLTYSVWTESTKKDRTEVVLLDSGQKQLDQRSKGIEGCGLLFADLSGFCGSYSPVKKAAMFFTHVFMRWVDLDSYSIINTTRYLLRLIMFKGFIDGYTTLISSEWFQKMIITQMMIKKLPKSDFIVPRFTGRVAMV
ncbi:LOW QUALITY PROTEIN: hypothetical protein M8C21_030035, partial [Ambrosia artemisiifolia]